MKLLLGDCIDVLELLSSASVDSCVTDPPYSLQTINKRFAKVGRTDKTWSKSGPHQRVARGFMGQTWDTGDAAFSPDLWVEVLRVLRPGAHLVAFGGTRTFHRLASAIEDAGFEIRDQIGWLFGNGFPKSHNQGGDWEGWGTALKPAWEPICLARKPLAGTVAGNLLEYGTGALNIDGCRVESEGGTLRDGEASQDRRYTERGSTNFAAKPGPRGGAPAGRWPANVIHDGSDEVLAAFPEAPGQQGALTGNEPSPTFSGKIYGRMRRPAGACKPRGDSGSAARFFYCAKASRADREEGCDMLPARLGGMRSETSGQHITRRDGGAPGLVKNHHPTVKPCELMRHLCRLVTPPGGVVLDPFMGSGSTGKAARLEGFDFIGIEREPDYMAIAEARIAAVDPFA